MEEMKVYIAKAIVESFQKDEEFDAYLGNTEYLDDITIDGSISLIKVAQTVIDLLKLDQSKTTKGYTEPSYLQGYVEGRDSEKRDAIAYLNKLGFEGVAIALTDNKHRDTFKLLGVDLVSPPPIVYESGRPDYSPREVNLLAANAQLPMTKWVTTENPPRKVEIKGYSSVDLDVAVVQIEGEDKTRWLMACGNDAFDGSIIGSDPKIWIREVI